MAILPNREEAMALRVRKFYEQQSLQEDQARDQTEAEAAAAMRLAQLRREQQLNLTKGRQEERKVPIVAFGSTLRGSCVSHCSCVLIQCCAAIAGLQCAHLATEPCRCQDQGAGRASLRTDRPGAEGTETKVHPCQVRVSAVMLLQFSSRADAAACILRAQRDMVGGIDSFEHTLAGIARQKAEAEQKERERLREEQLKLEEELKKQKKAAPVKKPTAAAGKVGIFHLTLHLGI